MTSIILSIKPVYAQMILDGMKQVEFRRVVPKKLAFTDYVYLYASAPVGAIVGHFRVAAVLEEQPVDFVWSWAKKIAGISEEDYWKYCGKKNDIGLIKIRQEPQFKPERYDKPLTLADFNVKRAPQNFCYTKMPSFFEAKNKIRVERTPEGSLINKKNVEEFRKVAELFKNDPSFNSFFKPLLLNTDQEGK